MFRLLLAASFACLLLTGCQEGSSPAIAPEAEAIDAIPASFNVEGNPTAEFQVPAIHCEGCCQGACDALAKVPGVVDVHANPVSKRVVMAVDDAYFDPAAARKALEDRFGEVVAPAESSDSTQAE
jgi:copper chaperone CopZ